MKAFLKTLLGGALGLGALYVVGKVCYEAGRDVAEIERQLEMGKDAEDDMGTAETAVSGSHPTEADFGNGAETPDAADDIRQEHATDDTQEKGGARSAAGWFADKIRNAKVFVRMKRTIDKKRERSPGILGSLLSNPDGARIEAFVRNGGVQINVTPRAA